MHLTVPLQLPSEYADMYEKTMLEIAERVMLKVQSEGVQKPYMNKKEAAQYIGVSFNTLQKFIDNGMPVIKVDSVMLLSKKDIDEFLEKNKQ